MPLDDELATVLSDWLDARLNDIHVALPGKIKSYDKAKQVADVIPVVRRVDRASDGSATETELPVIPNVPVRWLRGGGPDGEFYLHFPLEAGAYCQLIFNEAAIAQWRTTGVVPSSPGDLERHGLSYPFACPGGWPDPNPMPDVPAADAVLIVKSGSKLRVSTANAVLTSLVARADKVQQEFDTLKAAFASWVVVPNDGGAALKALIGTFAADTPTDVAASTLEVE